MSNAARTGSQRLVDIRPGVNVLSVFRHLNYRSWFALAEFVDNSLQSALASLESLKSADGPGYHLGVSIDVSADSPHTITVRDNAAGIASVDFERALKTAALPPDRTGLSEFGVGMKSAAFWFAPRWTLRSSALGEDVEREVQFDLQSIVAGNQEHLPVIERAAESHEHYTEVVLHDVHQLVSGPRTVGKIRSHLASIYRRFSQSGQLRLRYNGTLLHYAQPAILVAAPYNDVDAEPAIWRKEIDFDFGLGVSVTGFAAIRQTGSTKEAGFSLFRRNRLIEGGGDEPYRPSELFGAANKFASQRIFGELNLEGIDVTHTKDGFKWDDTESAFIDILRDYLRDAPLNLLAQAEHYRVGRSLSAAASGVSDVVDAAANRFSSADLARAADTVSAEIASGTIRDSIYHQGTPSSLTSFAEVPHGPVRRILNFELDGEPFRADLIIDDQPRPRDLYEVLMGSQDSGRTAATIKVFLNHPFMKQFVGPQNESLDAIIELLAAFSFSEIVARRAGVALAGALRRAVNRLLIERHDDR